MAQNYLSHQRALEREMRRQERYDREVYVENRESEAADENEDIENRISEIQNLLQKGLGFNPVAELKKQTRIADENIFDTDPTLRIPKLPILENYLPSKPSIFLRWLPSVISAFEARKKIAHDKFQQDYKKREDIIARRKVCFNALKNEIDKHNKSLIQLATDYASSKPAGVAEYVEFILQLAEYPEPIDLAPRSAYISESRQLVVDIELPTIATAIPANEKCRYVKKSDEIIFTKRTDKSRQQLHTSLIAQIALRCLSEICAADTQKIIETIVLNSYVSTIDPATGRPIHPCLISVRTSTETFSALDLKFVEPTACLKQLRASLSSQPGELSAVRPILELNMIDPRFIEESDILSSLDTRPNLMELSPSEFESLITNLFEKMGLETRLTQASRDGGVDCVAFDARPVLGGKVVIQAKRYKNTVGVSSVRDLFGTLHNEGASKGILVTTSGFGRSAYEFANGKPIELITGSNLLYLLQEHAQIEAKIEIPDDWVDGKQDVAASELDMPPSKERTETGRLN